MSRNDFPTRPASRRSVILSLWALAAAGLPAAAQQGAPLPLGPRAPTPAPAPASSAAPQPAPSVDRVNAYFNGIRGMKADFVQLSPDGRRYTGVLHLLRPGRMRFAYNPPAALEIVADGTSVAVIDKKIREQSEYFIGQTPLKFLLAQRIDVAKDSKVTDLKRVGNEIQLFLEDRNTLAGTSRIKVVFDGASHVIKEWTVTDPQGYDTRVMLSNLDMSVTPDRSLFVIERNNLIKPN